MPLNKECETGFRSCLFEVFDVVVASRYLPKVLSLKFSFSIGVLKLKYLPGSMLTAVSTIGCNDVYQTGSPTTTPDSVGKKNLVDQNKIVVNTRDRENDTKTSSNSNCGQLKVCRIFT